MHSAIRSVIKRSFVLAAAALLAALCLWAAWAARAQAQGPTRVVTVSAASYETVVASEEIVAAYGSGLSTTTSVGQDSDPGTPGVQLPTLLAGMSVEVNGRSAGLLFVSPGQINYVVPSGLEPGTGQVLVRGAGQIVAAGELEIRANAPALFTANADGQGVPAGVVLRVKADGAQSFEPLAQLSPATNRFIPRPLDLGPPGERVFLLLFLTGARRVERASDTRVLIGGAEFIPAFIGAAPGFVGLEQLNFELPRGLNGRIALALAALGHPTSNICEVEIAPPAGTPPRVSNLSVAQALAGQSIEITGSGFSPNRAETEVLITDVNNKQFNAQIESATTTSLRVMTPFGAGSGNLIVRTPRGESAYPFKMRTSASGIVQTAQLQPDGSYKRVGVRNVRIRALTESNRQLLREGVTTDDGSFVLPDVPPGSAVLLEIDGTTTGAAPGYNREYRKQPVLAERDNQVGEYIELRQNIGPTILLGGAQAAVAAPAAATPAENAFRGQTGQVVFEPNGSLGQFPDGTRVNELKVTVLDPGRTPADLPAGQFSSTIVQLTPFGARLTPGGKLTFPNPDGLPAGGTATLYRFDQTAGSATLGKFVAAGAATVSADGQRIESARDAVRETTYYFVSIPRPITTIYGSVVEEDNTPARGALVQVRGQSIFALTDQNGSFTLRNVPVIGTRELTLEVSYLRPDSTVDRTERAGVRPNTAGLTFVSPPIVLPGQGRTRAPVILAPQTLAVETGRTSEFGFLAYARVAGQTLRSVTVSGAAFATVLANGNDRYTLRLTPAANVTGTFTLTLTALDSQGLRTDETVVVTVRAPNNTLPIANSQSVATDEDTPVNIVLTGSGGATYRIVSPPQRGSLSGVAPNLTYTPARDYNGADSFSFTVSNGVTESSPAVVSIAVRPVNDAPRLDVAANSYTTNIGQLLSVVINGSDVDAGQRLTLTATGLPAGATITQTTATSWLLSWTPKFDQLGSYTVNLTLRDDGAPSLSASRAVTLAVEAKWAGTSQIAPANVLSLATSGEILFAGTFSSGVYRSTDNGVSWAAVNAGLSPRVLALLVKGNMLFAGTSVGVYRTTDNGVSWTAVSNGLPGGDVYALAAREGALFAGTRSGVYRSLDEGATWRATNRRLDFLVLSLTVKENSLFAGTLGGGVYRSTDDGANWTVVNSGLGNLNVFALVVKENLLFAGTGGGVYRSTDNGATWAAANSGPLSLATVQSLTVKENALLAGTLSSGVYRTTDNGASWTTVNNGLGNLQANALIVKENLLFAGTFGGLYRTADNGASWAAGGSGLGNQPVFALTVKENALLAGNGAGLHRTTDNGASWTAVNNGLASGAVNALTVKENAMFAGVFARGVYRTIDNGATWTAVNGGLLNTLTVTDLAVKENLLFAGTSGGGVFRTADNGASWTAINNGLGNSNVQALTVKDGALFAGAFGSGVYRTTDNGASWTAVNNGLVNQSVFALTVKDGALFAGTAVGVYRTTDNGANWTPANNGLSTRAGYQGVFALTVKGSALFAGGDDGVYRTTDNGASWMAVNNGLGLDARSVYALAVKDGALFAGTNAGVFLLAEAAASWTESNTGLANRNVNTAVVSGDSFLVGTFGGGVFRSTDKGQSWSPANTGLPPAAAVRAFTPSGTGVLAGVYGTGVYYSNDQGRTWTARNAGLTNRQINALAGAGATVYAGTNGGVFRSLDGGVNWTAANTGLTRAQVLSLTLSGGAVYAGTDNGLFRSTNQGASWTEVSSGLTDRYIVALGVAPDGTSLLAGTSGGLFRSTNQGQSWTPVTNGLPARVVALAFAQQGRRLLAGTVNGFFVSEDNGLNWRQVNGGLLTLQVGALAVSGETVLAGTRSGGVFVSQTP